MTAGLISTGVIFLFSICYTFSAFSLPVGSAASPGPGLLPIIAGVLAIGFSGWQLLLEIRSRQIRKTGGVDYPWRIVWFLLAFAVYIILFKPLGYVLATMLFTATLMLLMENKWQSSVITGVVTGIIFYFVFSLLSVPLPKGLLSGLKFL